MAITAKYEHLDHEVADCTRAKHRRLDRITQIHRVSKTKERTTQQTIRQIASELSKLDHPLIPHVIDFLEDDTHYHLVLEAVQPTRAPDAVASHELLDRLIVLEQAADALNHAAVRGIAHGDFSDKAIGVDGQGIIAAEGIHKIDGLGIKQLKDPTADRDELLRDDLAKLKSKVRRILIEHRPHADHDPNASQLEAGQHEAIAAMLKRVDRVEDDIASFSGDFRQWLHREVALREAKKLAFADPAEQDSAVARGGFQLPVIIACVATGILISCLLGYLFWPSSFSPDAKSLELASSTNNATPIDDPPKPSVTSDLEHVGTLNNLDNVSDAAPDATTNSATATNNEPEPVSNIAPNDTDAAATAANANMQPDSTEAQPETKTGKTETDDETSTDPAARTTTPFELAASSYDLPKTSSVAPDTLLTTNLRADERLSLTLYADEKTTKQTRFEIQEQANNQRWVIRMQRKANTSEVASITSIDGTVDFRWSQSASQTSQSNQLRNTVLEFRSGTWSHELPLRSPIQRPAASFSLERNRPYNIDIEHLPSKLFLEFVPSESSLTVASPQQIPWKDSSMTIGLDAGKDSLVTLQLKPQGRNKLRATGFARTTTMSRRRVIKPGFARTLRPNMLAMNQNLFTMKTRVKNIKGKDAGDKKKHVQKLIKALEEQKLIAEAFQETYAAAMQTKLHLRIYCEPGGRKLVLAEYGAETNVAGDASEQ